MYSSSRTSLPPKAEPWWTAKDNEVSPGSQHLMSGHLHSNWGERPPFRLWHFSCHVYTLRGRAFLTPLKTSEKREEIALILNLTAAEPEGLLTGQRWTRERVRSHKEEVKGTESQVQITTDQCSPWQKCLLWYRYSISHFSYWKDKLNLEVLLSSVLRRLLRVWYSLRWRTNSLTHRWPDVISFKKSYSDIIWLHKPESLLTMVTKDADYWRSRRT